MSEYNGWANYATWRVNLEIFDGMSASDLTGKRVNCASEVKDACAEYAENLITDYKSETSLAQDYALAFLADVNWWEIANHLIADEEEEEEEDETEEEGVDE